MESETRFRVAMAVVILLTMSVAAYYRLQAAASGEKISHREEGYTFAITLRLAGLGLWTATFGCLFFPERFAWARMPLDDWVRRCAVGTGAICAPLMYWTLSSLGRNLTDTVVTRAKAHLVTHGPYRWVRHPFYVTAALVISSVTLIAANWLIGLNGFVVLALLALRTPKEEQMLLARFGDGYRQYMAKTGRFFPRLSK